MSQSSENSKIPFIAHKNTPTKKDIQVLRDEMKSMETRITHDLTGSLQKQTDAIISSLQLIGKAQIDISYFC